MTKKNLILVFVILIIVFGLGGFVLYNKKKQAETPVVSVPSSQNTNSESKQPQQEKPKQEDAKPQVDAAGGRHINMYNGVVVNDINSVNFIEKTFNGYKSSGGEIIDSTTYGLEYFEKEGFSLIVFDKIKYGGKNTTILDVLEIQTKKDEQFDRDCYIKKNNTESDLRNTFAVVPYSKNESELIDKNGVFKKVLRAWKADLETEKIVNIDPNNVVCYIVGYGE